MWFWADDQLAAQRCEATLHGGERGHRAFCVFGASIRLRLPLHDYHPLSFIADETASDGLVIHRIFDVWAWCHRTTTDRCARWRVGRWWLRRCRRLGILNHRSSLYIQGAG